MKIDTHWRCPTQSNKMDSAFDYLLDRVRWVAMHDLDEHQINVTCCQNKYLEVTFKKGLYHIRPYADGVWVGAAATAPTPEELAQVLLAMGAHSA